MLLSANMIRLHDTFGIEKMFDVMAAAGIEGIDFNNDVHEYCTTEHDAEFYRELGKYAASRGVAICHSPRATLRRISRQRDSRRSFRASETRRISARR